MRLGGLQKVSLIDYPQKICAVLFASGCNFDCPYCHNPQLVLKNPAPSARTAPRTVLAFLKKRQQFLDAVVISGGEPTLQKDLAVFCQKIKRLGYLVKLDTNGSRPDVIQDLVHHGLVDYVAMDIKTDPFAYAPTVVKTAYDPRDILSSIGTIMTSGIGYEFRTTCIKPLVDADRIHRIGRFIDGARLYVLQQFHPATVLHPEYFTASENIFTAEEMAALQAVVRPWVQSCLIR